MASRRDDSFADTPWLRKSASPGRGRWDAGSPLNTLVDELIAQMGKDLAYLALARAGGFVGRFFPAGPPIPANALALQILSVLSSEDRLVLASDDPSAIEPKVDAIIEHAIFLRSYIHASPS